MSDSSPPNSSKELVACPFCGAGETQVRDINYWTGMRSEVIAVEIHHWCENQPRFQGHIVMKAKTELEARERWNKRT